MEINLILDQLVIVIVIDKECTSYKQSWWIEESDREVDREMSITPPSPQASSQASSPSTNILSIPQNYLLQPLSLLNIGY